MNQDERDKMFMRRALNLAQQAADNGEVPIGCVLVSHAGEVLGEGANQPIALNDPTAHAEILAIRSACAGIKNYRLDKSVTAYVTLEPCIMCAGALLQARVGRIVIAAKDSRDRSVHKSLDFYTGQYGNHAIEREMGVLADESQAMLYKFFKERR